MIRQAPKFKIDQSKIRYSKLKSGQKIDIDCTDNAGRDGQKVQYFIDKRALKNQEARLGTTYVISYKRKIIGYVTMATSSIKKGSIFKKARPSTRDGAIFPALIILELCIDKKSRELGFGEYALMWCNGMARIISEKVGCRYVILYTKDAVEFYRRNNYQIAEKNNEEFKLMYADVFPELKNSPLPRLRPTCRFGPSPTATLRIPSNASGRIRGKAA